MKNNKKIVFLKILSVLYLIILLYFLFFSERYHRNESAGFKYNLEPFAEIRRYLKYHNSFTDELFFVNIVGNIVCFLPLGIIIPIWFKKARNFFWLLICVIGFSLLVESLQFITKTGSFDVDDIILNSFGGILGFLVYTFLIRKFVEIPNKK